MRAAFVKALVQAAKKDPTLWLLTADLGYSFLEEFAEQFPDRFLNVGIAEQNMMLIAAGLALTGKKVVVYSIINFASFRCLEQIRNSICYHKLDVTVVGVGAGYFYGSQGYTHHGIEDIAVMRILPHMKIYSPVDSLHTEWITEQILTQQGPSYLRLGKSIHPPLFSNWSMDQASILREGKEVMIIALGEAVHQGLVVAKQLHLQGCSVGVMTFSKVAPIDEEVLLHLTHSLLVIIEEHRIGGLATIIAEVLMKKNRSMQVKVFHLPDEPLCIGGTSKELLDKVNLNVESIASSIYQAIKDKNENSARVT